jgi:hypothetical protein
MVEVQDIFRLYGERYRRLRGSCMSPGQYKAMRHIESCRTAALGGHVDRCDECGHERISYNSSRDRHCPKCQFLKKEKWLEDRLSDFLPIGYFHVVFTIPDSLNPIMLNNQRIMYDLFFRSVSETLKELATDKKHIGARIGFIAVLHTWGQNLSYHPHIHRIVTGGGLSDDRKKWLHSKNDFLFPVQVMGRLFRGKFLSYLKKEYLRDTIKIAGPKKDFTLLLDGLYSINWVVYAKPPFKKPETVFEYLARYTHRIAISNHRIIKIENDKVYFHWRDYSDGNRNKIMALDSHEFIRRFLLHVLPKQYVKIRHFGLFGNRNRRSLLKDCRAALRVNQRHHENLVEQWKQTLFRITGFDVDRCPCCCKGNMLLIREIAPAYCRGP